MSILERNSQKLVETMQKNTTYTTIQDLEVYKLARQLSKIAWSLYDSLHWQDKKVMGDQFITATDSIGANIAEGYGRFHYMDKINPRSLRELTPILLFNPLGVL